MDLVTISSTQVSAEGGPVFVFLFVAMLIAVAAAGGATWAFDKKEKRTLYRVCNGVTGVVLVSAWVVLGYLGTDGWSAMSRILLTLPAVITLFLWLRLMYKAFREKFDRNKKADGAP